MLVVTKCVQLVACQMHTEGGICSHLALVVLACHIVHSTDYIIEIVGLFYSSVYLLRYKKCSKSRESIG